MLASTSFVCEPNKTKMSDKKNFSHLSCTESGADDVVDGFSQGDGSPAAWRWRARQVHLGVWRGHHAVLRVNGAQPEPEQLGAAFRPHAQPQLARRQQHHLLLWRPEPEPGFFLFFAAVSRQVLAR